MKTEEIVDAARNAGFSSSEIMHRLAAFKQLINSAAYAEREKCTNTQEFVTLPRGAAERALAALDAEDPYRAAIALRAALEQPPTTEQSSAVEQQQGEQEPVALLADAIRSEPTELIHKWRVLELIQDHARKQPKRELMDNEARRIYNAATYHASLAVFMTRMDAENPDADDKGVSGWLQEAEDRVKRRITEAAHEIGQAAAPQQGEQEPVAIPDECPHIIWFDDSDMRPMMFAGRGARDAALKAFERVSVQWNAHLFVRIQKNSRDDQYPCAPLYTNPQPKRGPLTDDQISRLWSDAHNDTTDRMAFQVLARAIEASHNIK